MKIIKQDFDTEIEVRNVNELLELNQDGVYITCDEGGAKQLIEVLKEYADINNDQLLTTDENGNCTHFHKTFGGGECFDCGKKLE